MSEIKKTWDKYIAWMKERHPKAIAYLNEPATTEAIKQMQTEFGSDLPQEYLELISCHDGQKEGPDSFGLIHSDHFMTIDHALSIMKSMRKHSKADPDPWWRVKWIPLTSDQSGNYVCLEVSSKGNSPIIDFDHETTERTVLYNSLSEWLNSYVTDVLANDYAYFDDYGRFMPKAEFD